jgi:hypothetical protein
MTPEELRQLRTLFETVDLGWVFVEFRDERAEQIIKEMREVEACFTEKFQIPLKPPLFEQLRANTTALLPLIQSFVSPMTTPIRTMIFCVLNGASIERLHFDYESKRLSVLEVMIEFPTGLAATFSSDDIYDAEALRHVGLMKLGNAPMIVGYYPFRKEE